MRLLSLPLQPPSSLEARIAVLEAGLAAALEAERVERKAAQRRLAEAVAAERAACERRAAEAVAAERARMQAAPFGRVASPAPAPPPKPAPGALIEAAKAGDTARVRACLDAGSLVNERDEVRCMRSTCLAD